MDLAARLKSLLALAQHPSTPVDEARTAAFALLKTCRDNGVVLSFKLPRKEAPSNPPDIPNPGRGRWSPEAAEAIRNGVRWAQGPETADEMRARHQARGGRPAATVERLQPVRRDYPRGFYLWRCG